MDLPAGIYFDIVYLTCSFIKYACIHCTGVTKPKKERKEQEERKKEGIYCVPNQSQSDR